MDPPSASKVAIPRLPGRDYHTRAKNSERLRAPKSCSVACGQCRKRKIRCTGETPKCRNCLMDHVRCVYLPSRGNRLREANERNDTLVGFLKHLATSYGGQLQVDIDEFLEGLEESDSDHAMTSAQTTHEQVDERDNSGITAASVNAPGTPSSPVTLPSIATFISTPPRDQITTNNTTVSVTNETSSDVFGNASQKGSPCHAHEDGSSRQI